MASTENPTLSGLNIETQGKSPVHRRDFGDIHCCWCFSPHFGAALCSVFAKPMSHPHMAQETLSFLFLSLKSK